MGHPPSVSTPYAFTAQQSTTSISPAQAILNLLLFMIPTSINRSSFEMYSRSENIKSIYTAFLRLTSAKISGAANNRPPPSHQYLDRKH
jgi:hypothetical protein